MAPIPQYTLLDRWILERLHAVTAECLAAYEAYEFRKVFNALNQFCTADLSAIYIDATKDRMYCDAPDSPRRRRLAGRDARDLHQRREAARADPRLHRGRGMGACGIHHRHASTNRISRRPNPAFAPGEATKQVNRLFEIKYAIQTAIEACIQAKEFTRNNEADVDPNDS